MGNFIKRTFHKKKFYLENIIFPWEIGKRQQAIKVIFTFCNSRHR